MSSRVGPLPKGKAALICAFCNSSAHESHSVREMMFGLRERFTYIECSGCGALTLANPPHDLSPYYPKDYYSFTLQGGFSAKAKSVIRHAIVRAGLRSTMGFLFPEVTRNLINTLKLSPEMRILDVGGGNGQQVKDLITAGFAGALCIDPFTSQESAYCQKKSLAEVTGQWDRIMFHHSLEHIEDQIGTLAEVKRKLAPGGLCLIRIPVARWAWRHYGVNWVQLDAPRHMVIHTPDSMIKAAEIAGLEVATIKNDSWAFQFWGSELYRKDIPLAEGRPHLSRYFDAADMKRFDAKAKSLNDSGQGDQAAFILTAQGI